MEFVPEFFFGKRILDDSAEASKADSNQRRGSPSFAPRSRGQPFSHCSTVTFLHICPMGSLKKRRKAKINKHKRRKKLRAHRHKKRTWQK
jgi:hypothetical protein